MPDFLSPLNMLMTPRPSFGVQNFNSQSDFQKQLALRSYAAGSSSFPADSNAFSPLLYLASHSFYGSDKAYRKLIPKVTELSLSDDEKIDLGTAIAKREGMTKLSQRITDLDGAQKTQIQNAFDQAANEYLPAKTVSSFSSIEEVRTLAHNYFSGARALPQSLYHRLLVGCMYSNNPNLTLIKAIFNDYVNHQKEHFNEKGIWPLIVEKQLTYDISVTTDREITFLHLGGVKSIATFQTDDNPSPLQIVEDHRIQDPGLIKRAQQRAAANCDFPAFYTGNINLSELKQKEGKSGYFLTSPVKEAKVHYLQPKIEVPPEREVTPIYPSDADALLEMLNDPIQITNPQDPACCRLFGGEPNKNNSAESSDSSQSPLKETIKGILKFVLKCFAILFLFRLAYPFSDS